MPPAVAAENSLAGAGELIADHACRALDGEVAKLGAGMPHPQGYAQATRDLLQRAWMLADTMQHRAVAIDHVVLAMASGAGASSATHAWLAEPQRLALRRAAALRLAALDEPIEAEPNILALGPEAGLVAWLVAAAAVALRRSGDDRFIEPEDLLDAIERALTSAEAADTSLPEPLVALFRQAQADAPPAIPANAPETLAPVDASPPQDAPQSGHLLARVEAANRSIASVAQTASRSRTELRRLRQHLDSATGTLRDLAERVPVQTAAVDRAVTGLEGVGEKLAGLATRLDGGGTGTRAAACGCRLGADDLAGLTAAFEQSRNELQALREQMHTLAQRMAAMEMPAIASLSTRLDECRRTLADVDGRTRVLQAAVPRPPKAHWLAVAVLSTIGFGGTIGWLLAAGVPPALRETAAWLVR